MFYFACIFRVITMILLYHSPAYQLTQLPRAVLLRPDRLAILLCSTHLEKIQTLSLTYNINIRNKMQKSKKKEGYLYPLLFLMTIVRTPKSFSNHARLPLINMARAWISPSGLYITQRPHGTSLSPCLSRTPTCCKYSTPCHSL